MLHGYRHNEIIRNARGQLVKAIKQKDRKPAVERFFDALEYRGDCWIYHGSEQFWVTDDVVISPWRFSYEIHAGQLAPKHARFGRTCQTPKCCNPDHLQLLATL